MPESWLNDAPSKTVTAESEAIGKNATTAQRTVRFMARRLMSIRHPQRYAFVQPKATPPIWGSIASPSHPRSTCALHRIPPFGPTNHQGSAGGSCTPQHPRLLTHCSSRLIRPEQPLMTTHLQADYRLIAGKPASWFILHTFTPLPSGTQRRIGPSNSRQIERSRNDQHDPDKPDAGTPRRAKSTPPAQRRIQATQACVVQLAWCSSRCRCHARHTPGA